MPGFYCGRFTVIHTSLDFYLMCPHIPLFGHSFQFIWGEPTRTVFVLRLLSQHFRITFSLDYVYTIPCYENKVKSFFELISTPKFNRFDHLGIMKEIPTTVVFTNTLSSFNPFNSSNTNNLFQHCQVGN